MMLSTSISATAWVLPVPSDSAVTVRDLTPHMSRLSQDHFRLQPTIHEQRAIVRKVRQLTISQR